MYSVSAKRVLALGLALCLLLGCFTGCGRKRSEKPTEPDNLPPQLVLDPADMTTEATEPTEVTTEPTEAPTEETKETIPQGLPGVVAGEAVNVRVGPGTNHNTIASLPIGTKVYIQEVNLKTALPWGKIDEGWICLNYVQLEGPDELLQYASPALGLTMHSNVQLYNGPGTFYGKAGILGKDVRLNIFGIVGNWARIAEGWLLLDHVYIDCTEGPEEPVMGTVTGSGVNIRRGPGTHYNTVTSVGKGTRIKIFYIVDYYGYKWGCGESGWISMEYVLLDGDPGAAIVDTWCGHGSQDQSDSTAHIFVEWKFTAGGNYTCTQWIYTENMSGAADIKQSVSKTEGTYTFDGTKLTMNDKEVAYTLQNDKLYLDAGFGSKPHLKGSLDDAIKAFLAEKYPNGNPNQPEQPEDPTEGTQPPAPPAIDPAILGNWAAAWAYKSADGVLSFGMGDCWTFNSDGTFHMSDTETIWIYNADGTLGDIYGAGALGSKGTFTFDGSKLVVTCTHMQSQSGGNYDALATPITKTATVTFQNGVLYANWGSGNVPMYKGSAEEIAKLIFPGM